jgi:streptogramin lyase
MTAIHVIAGYAAPVLLSMAFLTTPAKPKSGRTAAPTAGIRTPGIQIPFSNLKPEAEIPVPEKSELLLFAKSAFVAGGNELLPVDVRTNKPLKGIAGLDTPCGGMAAAFDSIWVPLCGANVLARLDAKDYSVKAKLPIGASSTLRGTVASTADSVWALTDDKVSLVRIDPETNSPVGELRLPGSCQSLTSGESALWVGCPGEGKVLRINPATNLVEKRIDVAAQPVAVAVGQGSVWVLCAKDGKIERIDPKTNKVSKTIDLAVPRASGSLAFGDGSLWVSLVNFPLTRIDPKSDTVVQQFYGAGGGTIQASPGALWLLRPADHVLLRIDPKLVVATLPE